MNINDSTYLNQVLRASQGVQGVDKANQQAPIKPVASSVDENNPNNQSKRLEQEASRFDVSEEAIALLEEQLASSGSALAVSENETSSNESNTTNLDGAESSQYDQPSQQNLSAVAAYQSVDNIAQRENIKQFFGVNLFA